MRIYGKNAALNQIYDFDKRITALLVKLKNMNSNNSKKVVEYYKSYLKGNDFSLATQEKWLNRTVTICEWIDKDFDKATQTELAKLVDKHITRNPKYSDDSKKMFKLALRRFYQWLKGMSGDVYPGEVAWIKTPRSKNQNHKNPEDLLTDEDIENMIKVVEHPRDKALLMTLAESGCRIGEILTLQVKNINFDERGAYFLIDGKTGTRRVRVVNSTPFLHDWIRHHPDKDNPKAPLWIVIGTTKEFSSKLSKGKKVYEKDEKGEETKKEKKYKFDWSYNLRYAAARNIILRAAKKAGITKPVNPHNFRHSRATVLGAAGLNESIMNQIMGWKQGSDMAGVYIHLSGKQTDDALLPALYGMKVDEDKKKQSKLFPIKCIECGHLNSYDSKRCEKCNNIIGVLTKEDIKENSAIQQFENRLKELEDYKINFAEMNQITERFDKFIKLLKATGGLSQEQLDKMEEQFVDDKEFIKTLDIKHVADDTGMLPPEEEKITKKKLKVIRKKAWSKKVKKSRKKQKKRKTRKSKKS